MIGTILVPLDGSPLAEHALPYATALAQALDARLILIHARSSTASTQENAPDLEAAAARARSLGVTAETRVCDVPRGQQIGTAILGAADGLDVGLVVMATHGESGLGRWLYGSVTDQVLRQTTLPLLLVPPTTRGPWSADRAPGILLPLDGSTRSETILETAGDLAARLKANVLVLRVIENVDYVKPHGDECEVCRAARARGEEPDIEPVRTRRYAEEVAARLRSAGAHAEIETHIGDAAATIDKVARDRNVDLIAMTTQGRSGLARVILGSVATETLRRAGLPVLLVRPPDV